MVADCGLSGEHGNWGQQSELWVFQVPGDSGTCHGGVFRLDYLSGGAPDNGAGGVCGRNVIVITYVGTPMLQSV